MIENLKFKGRTGALVRVRASGTDLYTISENGRTLAGANWVHSGTVMMWIGQHPDAVPDYMTTNYDKCLYGDRMVAVWAFDLEEIKDGDV